MTRSCNWPLMLTPGGKTIFPFNEVTPVPSAVGCFSDSLTAGHRKVLCLSLLPVQFMLTPPHCVCVRARVYCARVCVSVCVYCARVCVSVCVCTVHVCVCVKKGGWQGWLPANC